MKTSNEQNKEPFTPQFLKSKHRYHGESGHYGVGDWGDSHVWIEAGIAPELRILLASYYNCYFHQGEKEFWLPVNDPEGTLQGWIKFSLTNKIHGHPMFSATEMRLANDSQATPPKLGEFITEGVQYPKSSNQLIAAGTDSADGQSATTGDGIKNLENLLNSPSFKEQCHRILNGEHVSPAGTDEVWKMLQSLSE